MLEALLEALTILLVPERMLFLGLGVLMGLVFGLLPGLGGAVGLSILLPFLFGMDPFTGVALLMGMAATTQTGDTFPSVLLGVPGSLSAQATVMDGYPLARQGEAARALSAGFLSSLFGGVIGAAALLLILPVAVPVVLALGSPELFMLTVLGMSMVAILVKGSVFKGMVAATIGLLLGTVGAAPAEVVNRFTFGSLYLLDGLPITVIALGLFALPELIDLLAKRARIAESAELSGRQRDGLKDVWQHRRLVAGSGALGAFIGLVPGIGGAVVDWIAYGVAKQLSRDGRFGEGDIRGVIAPESANNAKEGGSLIPTLLFGIPGSATTAILLSALVMFGVSPGPSMLESELSLTLSFVWTLVLANVLGTALCFLLSGVAAKLCLIEPVKLVPHLTIVMVVAAYQSSRHWGDIVAFLLIGILGWFMKHLGWPRPPILIGFVLAVPMERYLRISVTRYGWEFLQRPLALLIGLVTVGLFLTGVYLDRFGRSVATKSARAQHDRERGGPA